MSNRVEGLIWIDKNSPYRLKYHTNGEDYSVETSASYKLSNVNGDAKIGDILLPAGLLLKLDANDGIVGASFPDDLEEVLGVLTANVKKTGSGEATKAFVSRSGYLTIDEPWKVFKEFEELNKDTFNSDYMKCFPGKTYEDIVGRPVYWYIGSSSIGEYTSPELKDSGKLTLKTPVGLEWVEDKTEEENYSLNVAYDNLPQVGTLVKIEKGKIYLHLNFSKFDSTIEWTWPGVHDSESDCGKMGPTVDEEKKEQIPKTIKIRHGLFANSNNKHKVRSFCDIVALDKHEPENENEYLVQAPVKNVTTKDDRYTEITISSPETLYYRISGRVSYKFDKVVN